MCTDGLPQQVAQRLTDERAAMDREAFGEPALLSEALGVLGMSLTQPGSSGRERRRE